MQAVVYRGPGLLSLEEKPQPSLEKPTDAVVKILKTTICGTDLHIKKGDVPTVDIGRTLGHEGIGEITEIGMAVSLFKVGDKVLISCITSCGRCPFCKKEIYSHCEEGGWLLGNRIDGTQAEYVRIPFADTSLHKLPLNKDLEPFVMLSDILPTGYEVGVLKGSIALGSCVAIIGAGPIGLATLLTAQFYNPSQLIVIDIDDNRLAVAKKLGATSTINPQKENVLEKIHSLTGGKNVDVSIEAVGMPAAFDICQACVTPGGHLANIGVHGQPVTLHLENLWHTNITITTALVDTYTIPILLKMVEEGKLKPESLITHHFPLKEAMRAYEVFGNAFQEKALKIIFEVNGN